MLGAVDALPLSIQFCCCGDRWSKAL